MAAITWLIVAIAGTGTAEAQPVEAIPTAWRTSQVAVLPVGYYGRSIDTLFATKAELAESLGLLKRWQRTIEDTFQGRDRFTMVDAKAVSARLRGLPDFNRAVDLANDRLSLGIERYNELKAKAAVGHLKRAVELYRSVHAEIVEPKQLAKAKLYLGLAYMEQQQAGQAHLAFRDMWRLEPTMTVVSGYYPVAVQRALRTALLDVAAQSDKLTRAYPRKRIAALAKLLKVKSVVIAAVDGPVTEPLLRLVTYDADDTRFGSPLTIGLTDQKQATDALDRAASVWHTCALTAIGSKGRRRKRQRWFVDLSYSHSLWLTHRRTRDILQSPGAQITVAHEPTAGLHLYGRILQQATLRDPQGDLLDVFVTSHASLGAGLAVGSRKFRFFARAGLAAALSLSSVRMTTDVDCKHFGAGHPRCGQLFSAPAPGLWFGLETTLGFRWAPTRGWYTTMTTGMTSYVADTELTSELNFPLHATIGFGVPF